MADTKTMVKNGWFYRQNDAGKMLRIRKAASKPKKGIAGVLSDPNRLAKWQDNPGLRKFLPEKYLTSDQRQNRYLNSTPFAGADVTNRDIARQANNNEELQYGDQKRLMAQQASDLIARKARDDAWFQNYLGQVQAAQQAYSGLARDLSNANAGAAGGSENSPAVDNSVTSPALTAAKGIRGTLSSIAQQRMDQNNVAQAGLMAGMQNIVGAQRGQAQINNDQASRDLSQRQSALSKQAKLYNQNQRDSILNDSRRRFLENRAYGLNVQKAAAAASADASKTNQYGYTNAEWSKLSLSERKQIIADSKKTTKSSGGKGSGGSGGGKTSGGVKLRTTLQQEAWWKKVSQARSLWGTKITKDGIATGEGSWTEQKMLAAGFTPEQLRVAYILIKHKGKLPKSITGYLKKQGVTLNGRYPTY